MSFSKSSSNSRGNEYSNDDEDDDANSTVSSLMRPDPALCYEFKVKDNGEFDHHTEKNTTKWVTDFFRGRNNKSKTHKKSIFKDEDKLYEKYFEKEGSTWKTWKKRYFILRKDIKALCYFTSEDNLCLLGEIELEADTTATIDADAKGGYYYMKITSVKSNQVLNIRCDNKSDLTGLKYNIDKTIKAVSSIWWDHLFEDAKGVPSVAKEVLLSYHEESDKLHPTKPVSHDHSEQLPNEASPAPDDVKANDVKVKPPPFDFNYVDRNHHSRSGELVGTNICINLKDICKPGASLHVIMYALYGETLKEMGRTEKHELKSEEDVSNSSMNGDNDMKDIHIQFQAMLPKIPDDCRAVTFDIRQEIHDSKTTLCRVGFDPKHIGDSPVLKLDMHVLSTFNRVFKPSATLGLMIMSSKELQRFREKVDDFISSNAMKTKPYAEKMYSSESIGGTTIILDQLYASRWSASVPASLLGLLQKERREQFEEYLSKMKDLLKEKKEKEAMNNKEANLLETSDYDEVICPKSFDLLLTEFNEYEALMEKMKSTCEYCLDPSKEKLVEAFKNELQTATIPTIEGNISYGGTVLRKSKSRNNECYQAMTTNLNVHMVSSQWIPYSKNTGGRCLHSFVDVTPTITLGCPTAHSLKFKHGGLRSQLKRIAVEDRLRWMDEIQNASAEKFITFLNDFMGKAKDASKSRKSHRDQAKIKIVKKFFEIPEYTPVKMEEEPRKKESDEIYNLKWADVLLRKFQLAQRIDICNCQVLAVAISSVKLVLFLAANIGGNYIDILTRSLSIGFLIQVQSLLSAHGKEMGMIEDLDMAVLWLSSVTVRFQTTKLFGSIEGIYISRESDAKGGSTTVVDIEVLNEKEQAVLRRAVKRLERMTSNTDDNNTSEPVKGSTLAATTLYGVLFTQGINEMQTMTNYGDNPFFGKSHLKNIEQDKINKESLQRFHENYFNKVLGFNKEYYKGTSASSSEKTVRIEEDTGTAFGVNDQLLEKFNSLKDAISKGKKPEKHVDILYKSSILCRELGGTIAMLCKSGKDRTSMAVTLDTTRDLVERMGVVKGEDLLRVIRTIGVRRMNVFANTGQPNYAFNDFQVSSFPKCYQAPSKTYAGNVSS